MTTRGGSACRTTLHVCEVTIGNRYQRYKGGEKLGHGAATAGHSLADSSSAATLRGLYSAPPYAAYVLRQPLTGLFLPQWD